MRIFITGGTGLVGSHLVKKLCGRGDHAVVLSRRAEAAKDLAGENCTVVVGDPVQPGPWMDAMVDCDAVVHLAGEGIFNRRWSSEFKELILSSRVKSTQNIAAALAKQPRNATGQPKAFVSGSAIGYYGPHADEELSEVSLAGNDFLASVCCAWEAAAQGAMAQGVRVVLLRTGIVLAGSGGPLTKMLTPFKMFVGGPIAGGAQFMSWIHIDDEVGLILHALDHPEISGPLNATAPNPVSNRAFSTTLGKVLGRPSFLPTPGFALRVMLGEGAQIITTGQRVLPRKAIASGYEFKFTELEPALKDLLAK